MSRANTAARNGRRMHAARVAGAGRPYRQLTLAWAWVLAEARHLPDDEVEVLVRRLTRVARWLNGRRAIAVGGRRRR